MTLKDILVHAGAGKTTSTRLDLASALAATHQAHLSALHVVERPFMPAEIDGGAWGQVLQELENQAQARADIAAKLVRATEQHTGQPIENRTVDGETISTALLHSRYADLVVVGQGGEGDDDVEADGLADAIVMGAGRPVLVVPQYGRFPQIGERVVIAWKCTAEASRAVHDALPILVRAKSVTVMEVNPPTRRAPHIAGTDIAAHLARHGVRVEVSPTTAMEIGVGDAILSRAADLGADMIVMGAYGHSRLREFVFGGVTLHLLRHMTVPVLMSR